MTSKAIEDIVAAIWILIQSDTCTNVVVNYCPTPSQSGLQFLKRSLCVLCLFVGKFSNFYTVQYGKVQYSTGIYTVQILTFADDSSLTLKATNFFLYDQFLPRYKPTVLECCNILNKDSHRRSRRNLFSVVGLSSVCVFSP